MDETTDATSAETESSATGAGETTESTATADATKKTDEDALGERGKRALDRMKADLAAQREERKKLQAELESLAPLRQLAAALGKNAPEAKGKSEVEILQERFDAHQRELEQERQARWRAEVAAEKNLTPKQAARLHGTTRDELLADADDLLASFTGATPANGAPGAKPDEPKPKGPAPDRSQGAKGAPPSARPTSLYAAISQATKS